MNLEDLLARLKGVRRSGKGWSARCPSHDDKSASLSIKKVDGRILVKCFAGCAFEDVVQALGAKPSDFFDDKEGTTRRLGSHVQRRSEFDWTECVTRFGDEQIKRIAKWRGLSPEFVSWLRREFKIGLFKGNVAFPVESENGRAKACHYRVESGDWYFFPTGVGCGPFIFGNVQQAQYVLCFESQWDAFALMDKYQWHLQAPSDTAIFITRGADNGKLIRDYCTGDAIVYAFVQNDQPDQRGKIASEIWASSIAQNAKRKVLRVATPIPHKDLNDWTLAGATKSDLERARLTAEPIIPVHELVPPFKPNVHFGQPDDARPRVRLPGDDYLLSYCARECGKILSQKDIFCRDETVFTVDKTNGQLVLMTPDKFRTWMEDHVVFYRERSVGTSKSVIEILRTIGRSDAQGILASSQFITQLRPIRRLNPIRMPVMRKDNHIELLSEGYDSETETFTFSPVSLLEELSLSEAKKVLDDLLSEFKFADTGRSKSVAISAMLTVFAIDLLPALSLRPCFVYLANAEGAGKTLLAKCAIVPVYGCVPMGTKPEDESEMRKSLLTAVIEAKNFILFDNLKGHLSSPALEAFISSQKYNDRILGGSKSFTGDNNVIIFITGNGCTVSPDMRRRSLFCDLFLEEERAEDRSFQNELEVAPLLERRASILSALLALVQAWDKAGRPSGSRINPSFPEFSRIIAGIVESAGYSCPLENPNIEAAADTDGADMRTLIEAIADGSDLKTVGFSELVNVAQSNGLFDRFLPDSGELDRAAKSKLADTLKRYNRRLIGNYRFELTGKGRNRRYRVEKICR